MRMGGNRPSFALRPSRRLTIYRINSRSQAAVNSAGHIPSLELPTRESKVLDSLGGIDGVADARGAAAVIHR